MSESEAWATELETRGWVNTYLDGEEFQTYLNQEIEATTAILSDLGISQ
jgi:putative tricarboxylic transport membrane protein